MIPVIILTLNDHTVSLYLKLLCIGDYRKAKVLGNLRADLCSITVDCLASCDDQIIFQIADCTCKGLGCSPGISTAENSVCHKDALISSHSDGLTKYLLCLRQTHGDGRNLCTILIL